MAALYQRDWSLQIGTLVVTPRAPLRLSFSIEKDNKRTPNKAKIKVWNLSRTQRETIATNMDIQLRAGYKDYISTIFLGRGRRILSGREDVDVVLDIEALDSGTSYRDAIASRSFNSNTSILEVALYAIEQMGIGEGNIRNVNLTLANGLTTYQDGTTVQGPARNVLDRIIRASGLRWSIQDGALQVRSGTTPIDQTVLRLAPGTGLSGSPRKTTDGKVVCRSQLIPGLFPGKLIVLDSLEISGNYSIERLRFVGDTFGDDWFADLTMRDY